jgi:Arc/MetJ-type ribon-helix-helix transcriptional regulator
MPTRSFRTVPAVDRQIDELINAGYGNKTQVINAAIAFFHYEQLGRPERQSARRVELWQHRQSGERFAVLVDSGIPLHAVGPLDDAYVASVMAGEQDVYEWGAALGDNIAAENENVNVYRRVWPEEASPLPENSSE